MRQNRWTDKEVENFWDSVADIYVSENAKVKNIHEQRFKFSLKKLGLKKGQNILNITSRDGGAFEYLRNTNLELQITNSEISANLIEVAKDLHPDGNYFKIETYSNLPFDDKSFDRILTLETLEHCSEPLKFLEELHRVSKDNTVMVLSCPPATSEIPYQIHKLVFGGHGEGPHRFLPSKEVKKLLITSGWELLEHHATLLFPFGPTWFQNIGELIISKLQNTFISELGIRQFYVCKKL